VRGATKKKTENSKKKAENSTFKPLSTIFVPCLKIQEGHCPLPPMPTPMSPNFIFGGAASYVTNIAWSLRAEYMECMVKTRIRIPHNSQSPRFHISFWLSHILVYFLYFCPSFCPSWDRNIINKEGYGLDIIGVWKRGKCSLLNSLDSETTINEMPLISNIYSINLKHLIWNLIDLFCNFKLNFFRSPSIHSLDSIAREKLEVALTSKAETQSTPSSLSKTTQG